MKAYTFLADGFETVEALAVVDLLRRSEIDVVTVSVEETEYVTTAQNIVVKADELFGVSDYSELELLFLPGGGMGTKHLEAHEGLRNLILKTYSEGKLISAICAAPSILGHLGLLEGKRATCFPGFEKECYGAEMTGARVECSDNIITGRGMGTAIDLGLKLVSVLLGEETAEKLSKITQYVD